jgi:hypothetical protein
MIAKPFRPILAPLAYSADGVRRLGTPRGRRGPGRAAAPAGYPAPARPHRSRWPRPRVPCPPAPQILTETGRKTIFFVIVCRYPPDKGGSNTQ